MEEDLLETSIREYIQAVDDYTVFFSWHGGEPTLAGLNFYRRAFELQKKYARKGQRISNSFQTNGVLVDEAWCQLFLEGNCLVGISIDGNAEMNDAYRKTAKGRVTFPQVMRAVGLMKQFGVKFNPLATVTPANVNQPEALYSFLTQELGANVVQIQACAERKDFETVSPAKWDPQTLPIVGSDACKPGHPDSIMTEWSISGEAWGEFLCRFFDAWYPDRDRVVVNLFDTWASQFAGGSALMCITSPVCGRALSMERDGRVFSCDRFVNDEYCIGNVKEQPLNQIVRSKQQRAFGEAKSKSLPKYCRECEFLSVCYGECPKRRFLGTPDGEPGLNYLCPGFKQFFSHASTRLQEHGRQMLQRKAATAAERQKADSRAKV
jgi:uncharacterized protein